VNVAGLALALNAFAAWMYWCGKRRLGQRGDLSPR